MKDRTNLTLSIDSKTNLALKIIAAKKGVTKADLIEIILQEYSDKERQALNQK